MSDKVEAGQVWMTRDYYSRRVVFVGQHGAAAGGVLTRAILQPNERWWTREEWAAEQQNCTLVDTLPSPTDAVIAAARNIAFALNQRMLVGHPGNCKGEDEWLVEFWTALDTALTAYDAARGDK